ncbi:MAG: radical SAM protein [Desulfohalobiaceae bacterium]
MTVKPRMVFADHRGRIFDHPHLLMVCRKGREFTLPKPDDLIPLPQGSDLFLLPGRNCLGFDQARGSLEYQQDQAVAGFVSPGHTLSGTCSYVTDPGQGPLPMFAYAALGYARGRFWVCAKEVDQDQRQNFQDIDTSRIEQGADALLQKYPDNRLLQHLAGCAKEYCCPAARNLALGRHEAPLPTARQCNANCVGCISKQPEDSGFPATQQRLRFQPSPQEILEVMLEHARNELRPIFSFGQGCEGEPLTEAKLLQEAISAFRSQSKTGTININTNASLPSTIPELAKAGLDSIRVSLNSVRQELYDPYFRPQGYRFQDVLQSIRLAKEQGLFVSLNYLFFPGINDSEKEFAALEEFVQQGNIDFIQLRNLNLDPELYLGLLPKETSPSIGLKNFLRRLRKNHPQLGVGYFNPYLG